MIKIDQLLFSYESGFTLDIKQLEIKDGEFVSIIGPNGSGKSTFVKLLSGVIRSYRGSIVFDKVNIRDLTIKKIAQKVSVVPQEFSTIYEYNVDSIVSSSRIPFARKFSFSESYDDKKAIEDAMKKTDTLRYKNEVFGNLSGGEKQRVMIARAVAQNTDILILDEFVSHLDPGHAQELLKLVKTSNKDAGKTIISVFHDINTASLYSDRIIVFNKGGIFSDGTPYQVITEKMLNEIYSLDATIIKHPLYNKPQVIYN
ncbi:MAG TPA: ABC transporter ATP-binding protein [Petrotogaceae bacterium]|jgi:iron complex transport system ATP-binding protein|nr:ABC transporter ATP-binding protein [Petrotogaceae bacterium]